MSQETFERELARRADAVHGAPLSFDDVRGKARSIRRRRRAAVASGVAAAVALVVIVPSVLAGGPDKGSRAPEPAPPVPGHTAVLHDGTVTLADGTEVDLGVDNERVSQMGVLTDGRIVLGMNQPLGVRVYDGDGSRHVDYPAAYGAITMSPRDDVVAWVGRDLTVSVLAAGGAEPSSLPGKVEGSIDAVLDAEHLLVGDSPTTWGELTPDGVTDLGTSEPLRVTDVNADGSLWAVQYADDANAQYGCAGLYDPERDTMVARTCETAGLRFSPDGEHLLGAYAENNMAGDLTVVDLDLEPVSTFDPEGDGAAVSRAAWADSEHLLASVTNWRTSSWTLEEVALDGTSGAVAGPADGGNPETMAEYVLSE